MNPNTEAHFSRLPAVEIQRSTFDRSASIKTSFNAGDLIPFYVEEVLPGDTFDITTAKVVRSQTMLTPVMDNMYLDTFYFFVPNRLVWSHWKEFCGENSAGAWAPTVQYTIPSISAPSGGFAQGTIADYLGLPIKTEWDGTEELAPSVLPFRAYALVCNEFFRDENLTDPLLIPLGDANQIGTNGDNYISDVANGGMPFRAAKYHGYFTSALPNSQKGNPVNIPIDVPVFSGGTFPVTTAADSAATSSFYPLLMARGASTTIDPASNGRVTTDKNSFIAVDSQGKYFSGTAAGSGLPVAPSNLVTTIPAQSSGSAAAEFSVNELRLAFAYQRYLEALARSGSRYTELLLGLFNVRADDASLQRPEYLGGNRVPINVNEVTNTAQTQSEFLGDLGAKSQTNDNHHDFIKSFTEHGLIIGVCCVRYDHSYSQGIQRFWTRKTFTDFYNPKFAHLGETPIYQAEIWTDGNNLVKNKVFGYQEIWADYRYRPNMVTSEMRPNADNSLSYWHLGDYYTSAPLLSDEWIRETPANVDRVLSVTSSVANQFWADIYVMNKCTRPMPLYSVPGLIDHF